MMIEMFGFDQKSKKLYCFTSVSYSENFYSSVHEFYLRSDGVFNLNGYEYE